MCCIISAKKCLTDREKGKYSYIFLLCITAATHRRKLSVSLPNGHPGNMEVEARAPTSFTLHHASYWL